MNNTNFGKGYNNIDQNVTGGFNITQNSMLSGQNTAHLKGKITAL